MLLGYFCNENIVLTREHVEAAKQVLQRVAFVGLTDFYAESICLFHQMYGGVVSYTAEFENDRYQVKCYRYRMGW